MFWGESIPGTGTWNAKIWHGKHLAYSGNNKVSRSFCARQTWHLYVTLYLGYPSWFLATPALASPLPDFSFLCHEIPRLSPIHRCAHFTPLESCYVTFLFSMHPLSCGFCFFHLILWHTIPTLKDLPKWMSKFAPSPKTCFSTSVLYLGKWQLHSSVAQAKKLRAILIPFSLLHSIPTLSANPEKPKLQNMSRIQLLLRSLLPLL